MNQSTNFNVLYFIFYRNAECLSGVSFPQGMKPDSSINKAAQYSFPLNRSLSLVFLSQGISYLVQQGARDQN